MSSQKATYKCKLCPFTTSNRYAAWGHIYKHISDSNGTQKPVDILEYMIVLKSAIKSKKDETQSKNSDIKKIEPRYYCKDHNPKHTYRCKCSPNCQFEARPIRKLIRHAMLVHHTDKSKEWVIAHFTSLFIDLNAVSPKKKIKIKVQNYNKSTKIRRPQYNEDKSGFVYQSRVNPNFDYDLDGRVK